MICITPISQSETEITFLFRKKFLFFFRHTEKNGQISAKIFELCQNPVPEIITNALQSLCLLPFKG